MKIGWQSDEFGALVSPRGGAPALELARPIIRQSPSSPYLLLSFGARSPRRLLWGGYLRLSRIPCGFAPWPEAFLLYLSLPLRCAKVVFRVDSPLSACAGWG